MPADFPFQLLYTTPGNSFTVKPGTQFYVPIAFVDDSPPILGDFPSDPSGAQNYFFGASELGGNNFAIVVDGKRTSIGPSYLVGPVATPPLSDGGGTHYIVLAAFLTPLSPGSHTVTIEGQFSGKVIIDLLGDSFSFSTSYTVKVQQ